MNPSTLAFPTSFMHALPMNHLALFDITGIDAASFLQGQLTQDVLHWQPNEIKRAAWCTPKGRMLVSLYIWQVDGGFRCLIARDLLSKVTTRLKMFVLRAKVSISNALDIALFGTSTDAACAPLSLETHSQEFCLHLLSTSQGTLSLSTQATNEMPSWDWNLAHIRAGVAWINASNTEQFVPQTTNFELVGGISFSKGCYPGQEVVARSQYLSKLKQRAAIFSLPYPDTGDSITLLSDIFVASDIENTAQPIGRVILSANSATDYWLLCETPHALIESNTPLSLHASSGQRLTQHPLPYSIENITE
jgi:tRNA-modifying protein YgfZ